MFKYVSIKLNTAAIFEGGHVPELVVGPNGQEFVQLSSLDLLTKSRMPVLVYTLLRAQ